MQKERADDEHPRGATAQSPRGRAAVCLRGTLAGSLGAAANGSQALSRATVLANW